MPDWWVLIKLATTAGLAGVSLLVLLPRLAANADAATNSPVQSFSTAERLPLAIASSVAVVLLVGNAVLGMYKPAGRVRIRRKPVALS